jgi:hypothetical protein
LLAPTSVSEITLSISRFLVVEREKWNMTQLIAAVIPSAIITTLLLLSVVSNIFISLIILVILLRAPSIAKLGAGDLLFFLLLHCAGRVSLLAVVEVEIGWFLVLLFCWQTRFCELNKCTKYRVVVASDITLGVPYL